MEIIDAQKREIVKEAREAAKEAREAETTKREAEELLKRDELETMERIEREKNMTLSVRIAKRQSGNVRKSAKRLKGIINYFAIWKRQNWHKNKKE